MMTIDYEAYHSHYRDTECSCGHMGNRHAWTPIPNGNKKTVYEGRYCKACREGCLEYSPELWQQTLPGTGFHPRKGIQVFSPAAAQ